MAYRGLTSGQQLAVSNLIQIAQQQQLVDSGYWFGQEETTLPTETGETEKASVATTQSAPFSVPKLAVDMGDCLEQFDDSFFEETSLELAKQDPYLSEEEFPKDAPTGILPSLISMKKQAGSLQALLRTCTPKLFS